MWSRIDSFLQRRSQRVLWVIASALTAGIAIADEVTGFEVASSPFYFVSVGIAAWYGSRAMTAAMVWASAAAWVWADMSAGRVYSNALIPMWNGLVRLAVFAVIGSLVVAVREALARAHQLANTDPMTGLLNSRAFFTRAVGAVAAASPSRPAALCYIDLDNFKQVNDRRGHSEGDKVLIAVARLMRACVRQGDLVARVGGDEFALLLLGAEGAAALAACERLREALRAEAACEGWPVTMSVGVAVLTAPVASLDAAVQRADALMYQVKASGKDRALVAAGGEAAVSSERA